MKLRFKINGKVVEFEEEDEIVLNGLLYDDEFTLEFIATAIIRNKLTKYGFYASTDTSALEIERITEQFDDIQYKLDNREKLWSKENVTYFVTLVQENQNKFETDLKKHVWTGIAHKCMEQFKVSLTSMQCESKWKQMKRTYKSVLQHNSSSGKSTKRWEFFEIMHNFLYNKPEIRPVATCSNSDGLIYNAQDKEGNTSEGTDVEISVTKERPKKRKVSAVEERHRDKMARQDRFLELLEKIVEKM
ncbi:Myb/SANT-like DNA-binding domain [Popillia japonica]|uniref:Myb/SANT-like DNA-binding domain n=1 Tax=Popillia japonica TaxID=7064 RepID=A0AAW1IC90_POPJA